MGFKVVESVVFANKGIELQNTEYTLLGSYEVKKSEGKYNVEAYARVYGGVDHTKAVLDVIRVGLVLDSLSDGLMSLLYARLKEDARFTGKTIIDN